MVDLAWGEERHCLDQSFAEMKNKKEGACFGREGEGRVERRGKRGWDEDMVSVILSSQRLRSFPCWKQTQ